MAVGAVMGTVAFNAGFILGIVGLINPVAVQINPSFIISAIFIFLPFLLFNIFVATKNAISKKEGVSVAEVCRALIEAALIEMHNKAPR